MPNQDFDIITKNFESFLFRRQPTGTPDTLYEPIRYINTLGGKRIRPVLLLMAYNLWKEDITPALPAALAVEFFHNFSLMHDDIMDEAPLRRGQDSVHKLYGRNAAILSGDAMLIQCFDLLLEAGREGGLGAKFCELMCQSALEICEGQQSDMDFEKLDAPSEEDYLKMVRQKTACLLGLSMRLGALLAGANERDAGILYQFGEKMGLGFQIQDDYLDVFGDEKLTGKQRGGDILQGKKNYLYVTTCNKLSGQERTAFMEAYAMAALTQETTPVYEVYARLKIEDKVKKMQKDYFREAKVGLHTLENVDVNQIMALAERLSVRSY